MSDFSDALTALMDAALIQDKTSRDHLSNAIGAGILGNPAAEKPWEQGCDRQIYYDWQKTPRDEPGPKFPPRLYRIFDMGHDCEARMAGYLRLSGLVLRTEMLPEEQARLGRHSPQYGYSRVNNKVKGKLDGILAGWREGVQVPDGLAKLAFPAIWETKAIGPKQFKDMKVKGLKVANPGYFGQCQINMAYMKLHENPCLFTAISRDTGDLHAELIAYEGPVAQAMSDRAVRLLRALPENGGGGPTDLGRAGDDPDKMPCRFCGYKKRCLEQDTARPTESTTATARPDWL